MIPQLSYTQFHQGAMPGQIADLSLSRVITCLAETELDAGLGVVQGTAPSQGKAPTSSDDVTLHFRGFAVYLPMKEPHSATARYAIADAVPVLRVGTIWVVIGGTVLNDGPAYLVYTGADKGKIRGDNTNAGLIPSCKVIEGGSAGSLAKVEINLP